MEGLCADRPGVARGPGRQARALRTSAGGCADRLFQSRAHRGRHLDPMPVTGGFSMSRNTKSTSCQGPAESWGAPEAVEKHLCRQHVLAVIARCFPSTSLRGSIVRAAPGPTRRIRPDWEQHADIEVCARDVRALDQRMARHPRVPACCALTVGMMGGCDAG